MPGFGMGSPASSEGIRDQGSPTGSGVVCPTVSGVVEAESVMNTHGSVFVSEYRSSMACSRLSMADRRFGPWPVYAAMGPSAGFVRCQSSPARRQSHSPCHGMMLPRTCPSGSSASLIRGPFAQAEPDRMSTSLMVNSLPSMLSLFVSSIGRSFAVSCSCAVWSSGM